LPEFHQSHYSNKLSKAKLLNNNQKTIQLKIKEILKPDRFSIKYIGEVLAINNIASSGLILVNLKKDTLKSLYTIDDLLLVSSKTKRIPAPLNPYQFDYSNYMRTGGVYHQIHISKRDIIFSKKGLSTLRGRAEKIRNFIIEKLRVSPMTPDELSIVQAFILGQRKDISKQVYIEYAAAGAIHILAVSGMHVGIIYIILLLIFSPLKGLPYGLFIQSVLIVISLWGFAFLTGLSPSVIRAVTMFSFFAFASLINRKTNSINTLFLSYFLLILINPLWIFHVGFQLSYLAVFFILWILPLFNKLYNPQNFFIKKIWDILMVTIAAQLGIIPLSLYYFHQFPGLFFLTNIVVLPFLGILLGAGLIIIILAVLNTLPDWLALSYNFLIGSLNSFINWVANQDAFLIQDIHFSIALVLGSYLMIFSFVLLWKKSSFNRILNCLLSILILIGILIWEANKNSDNQLVFFHKNRTSLIGYKQNTAFVLFRNDSTLNFQDSYPIKGYRVEKNISQYSEEKLPQIFSYRGKIILRLDSLGIYPKTSKVDIVWLSFSPQVHLERMIDSLQPKLIIADGNNYISYVYRWRKTCNEKKLPFHFTGTEGAYILNFNPKFQ
jgi:competence protein ComEC